MNASDETIDQAKKVAKYYDALRNPAGLFAQIIQRGLTDKMVVSNEQQRSPEFWIKAFENSNKFNGVPHKQFDDWNIAAIKDFVVMLHRSIKNIKGR